uniref:non-specific serine/threonine protein kinase n=1 Tax=Knipowitschia caucasica TaxID=637954 RepID=A0AAV2KC20_KNICA
MESVWDILPEMLVQEAAAVSIPVPTPATGQRHSTQATSELQSKPDNGWQKQTKRRNKKRQQKPEAEIKEKFEQKEAFTSVKPKAWSNVLIETHLLRNKIPDSALMERIQDIPPEMLVDLKIENFLLDEHNNIKIVDFGLSNTLRPEALTPELLSTQCGSPAYAAPELLAHRKYGPKVDVWSVGVSTFAMLTGTLPFTVEPFNIKHLHQKMINGEIGNFPNDVSKGAVSFVLSLLEPDPVKRPSVRAAMEERWINEGYGKKSLPTAYPQNRLCAEDLNSSVLTYMTDSLGFSLSDVIHTLTNNRPSPIMTYYHLLLNKFHRSQKGAKTTKRLENDWTLPSKNTWKERNGSEIKVQQKNASDVKGPKQGVRAQRPPQTADRELVKEEIQPPSLPSLPHLPQTASPPVPRAPSPSPAPQGEEEEVTPGPKEPLFPEVTVFRERELVRLSPPKSSASQLCDSAPCQVSSALTRPALLAQLLRTTRSDGTTAAEPASHCFRDNHLLNTGDSDDHLPANTERLEKLQTFYATDHAPVSARMILDTDALPDRDSMETVPSPLPRLKTTATKDTRGNRKLTSWLSRPPGLLVNGSKPAVYPPRQHTLVFKSLRQDRGKRRELSVHTGGATTERVGAAVVKRNAVQIKASLQRGLSDLNLPLLPTPLQKPERKNRLHGMDY